MNPTSDIHNILEQWGQNRRSLPLRNEALKSQLLERLNVTGEERPVRTGAAFSRIPWLPLLLAGTAVFTFIVSAGPQRVVAPVAYLEKSLSSGKQQYQSDSAAGLKMDESNSMQLAPVLPVPPVSTGLPASDNREFLKTDYSANIKSRHVQELAGRLQTMVRGYDGRIDSASVSEAFGSISFVVPAEKFEAFRNEVKSVAGARFYSEQTGTQNLLPQKRSIEDQQKAATENLSQLQANRGQLISAHEAAAADLQAQINTTAKQLAAVQSEIARHPERKTELEPRQQQLQAQLDSLRNRLDIENRNYAGQLSSFDSQIQATNTLLKNLDDQTGALLDNVATVNGTIYLSHISWWGALNLYVPAYWISLALLVLAIVTYWIQRRSYYWTV